MFRKNIAPDVFGNVLEKVKHRTNDASNNVSRPALDNWHDKVRSRYLTLQRFLPPCSSFWLHNFHGHLEQQNVNENNVSMSHLDATPLPKNHSAKSPSPKDQIVGTKSFHFKFMSSQSGTAKPHLDIC